jgi:hypothetical protein
MAWQGHPGSGAQDRSSRVTFDPNASTARNGQGRTGLLCGLVSLGMFWLPVLSWIPAVAGIVLSSKGLSRSSRGDSVKTMARWGLVVSILALVVSIVLIVLVVTKRHEDVVHLPG